MTFYAWQSEAVAYIHVVTNTYHHSFWECGSLNVIGGGGGGGHSASV